MDFRWENPECELFSDFGLILMINSGVFPI
jgi:hypothetical protein